MPTQISDMEKVGASDFYKLMLIGLPGAGKSKLASTARKPELVLEFDRKPQSYAGVAGCYCASLTDPSQSFEMPTAYNAALDIIGKLEKTLTLKDILPTIVGDNNTELKTLVIDSGTCFAATAMAYALYNNKDLRREVSVNSQKFFIPKSWDGWGAEQKLVESVIFRAMALPLDFIITFHEVAEEMPDSTSEHVRLSGRNTVFPVRYNSLLKYFTEKWRVERGPNMQVPTVHISTDPSFNVSTCMNLDGTAQPDIMKILELHNQRTKK